MTALVKISASLVVGGDRRRSQYPAGARDASHRGQLRRESALNVLPERFSDSNAVTAVAARHGGGHGFRTSSDTCGGLGGVLADWADWCCYAVRDLPYHCRSPRRWRAVRALAGAYGDRTSPSAAERGLLPPSDSDTGEIPVGHCVMRLEASPISRVFRPFAVAGLILVLGRDPVGLSPALIRSRHRHRRRQLIKTALAWWGFSLLSLPARTASAGPVGDGTAIGSGWQPRWRAHR